MTEPEQIGLDQWDARYRELKAAGMTEPDYGGPLRRHLEDGDLRLQSLRYDNSAAGLRLWNFLLSEEDRLHAARRRGDKLVGTMKDLGTVPVMAYALENVVAFYPDGAWWIPCVMQLGAGLLKVADDVGLDEHFCPVRAMVGAFLTEAHFPVPDLLTCSVGATCDDFSAIAQRLEGLGFPILWWEIPARRTPDPGEPSVTLPGGTRAPEVQLAVVRREFDRIRRALEQLSGTRLTDEALHDGICRANGFRRSLRELRDLVFAAPRAPLGALELLIAEMIDIHFCSDRDEACRVLDELLVEVRRRVEAGTGVLGEDAVKLFWVNPVADLRMMNLLEECGGRLCGTEFLFTHALDDIDETGDPMDALCRSALADPMVGPVGQRCDRIVEDARRWGARGVVVCRIPGASHCAWEGELIAERVRTELDLPVVELEVPPIIDPVLPTLRTRLEALIETTRCGRTSTTDLRGKDSS
ncbi:MAG: 2-hydroxyacyl-CoA dehydratase [Planctomycetota bacterium]